jgi:cytochrome P450
MGVAPPPPVPSGVLARVRSDMRTQRAARGTWPAGELSFSLRRTREFEREPLPLLLRCHERYGPVFSLRLLYAPIVFALGPEANHYMTVSHASNFRWRDGGMGDLIPLLGDGLLTTDGDYHRRARRIMLPAFHREQLAASTAIMAEEAEKAVSAWQPGERVDLYAWTRRLALRIAMRALFGFEVDRDARDARMAAEFEEVLGYWGRDYVLQMLRGPGSPWRSMTRTRAKLDGVIFAEIARRRVSGERGVDILSLLLDAVDEDGVGLSDRELRDQVMTLLFAGHDTTTSTVAFMFYELARNPAETPADDAGLDMVLDETLRMYPPAWIGPRRSIEPFELCGVRVPGGVMVNYCSWASHHLPDVFPDPWRFRPSRFAPEAKAALPRGAYVPFGGGSRTCIGMRFGQLEIKAIAGAILQRFRLELADPSLVPSIRQMPTLSPRGGMPVVVRAGG